VKHRFPLATATALAIAATVPCAAGAQELTLTAQAVAAHAEFLTQAPPPPVQGVLCLVDSGVDVNPDTESILVGRESLFGGTLDDVTAYHHGTYVSMVAGAAANGWGMVGAWPQLKVLSIRALPEASAHMAGEAYRAGILRCVEAKNTGAADVRVVELALGGPPTGRAAAELAQMADAVAYARQFGIVVISAAGNDGSAVNAPAALPGVIAVGAAGRDGALCGFSSRGPELDLTSLGCDMDVATVPAGDAGIGQSTSLASAFTAGIATALRSYRPDLSVSETEQLLIGQASASTRMLDASATFRAAALGSLVDAYRPPAPIASPAPAPAARLACDPHRRVCAVPRLVRQRRGARRIVVRLASVPKGAAVLVRVNGRKRLRTRSRIIRIRVRRNQTVSIRFVARGRASSEPLIIRPKKR
jgi:hypothetical protein